MQRNLLGLFLFLLCTALSGQRLATWDGDAGDNLWETPANWSGDVAPISGDTVVFPIDVTVGGNSSATPVALRINAGAQVTLALNLTVGDATTPIHAVNIADGRLVVENNFTLALNPEASQNGINIGSGASTGMVNVKGSASLAINGGKHAINLALAAADFTQRGTLTISSPANSGIRLAAGTFTNKGSITISDAGENGIDNSGVFVNEKTDITITGAVNRGIKNKTGATFTNQDDLSVTAAAGSGRAIEVDAGSNLSNTGLITLAGGEETQRLANGGTFTNDVNGKLDVTDGRVNNSGTLTNNGFIVSTRSGTGIFNSGTANNNGFFSYVNAGGNAFTSGSSGTENDLGINVDQNSESNIESGGSCTVDIAEVGYDWTRSGNPIGTSDATGSLTFDPNTLPANPTFNIRTTAFGQDFFIRVKDVCISLPVDFAAIKAVNMGKTVMVKWQTAYEENNDYMAVERSGDGFDFVEIGRLAGAGTTGLVNDYELADARPLSGVNYYRIRQVDFDGSIQYSQLVSTEMHLSSERTAWSVFPTVVAKGAPLQLDLRGLNTDTARDFYLTDANGRQLQHFRLAGGGLTHLPITKLRPGMYYLSSQNGDLRENARFIIR